MQRIINFFPLVLLICIIIAFIFLQPTSIAHFPSIKQKTWNNFIVNLYQKKRMDVKDFWMTRQFYSTGYFQLNINGFSTDDNMNTMGLSDFQSIHPVVFLQYHSPDFTSYESLVSEADASNAAQIIYNLQKNDKVIAAGNNYAIIQFAPEKAKIFFIASNNEMMSANGYALDNKDLLQGKTWLSISEVLLQ